MAARILITGAASVLGAEVVRRFVSARVPVRAASHGVLTDERYSTELVENLPFDFTDKELVKNALKDIRHVFLLLPLTSEMGEYARIFINQAAISGVSHIVHVSFLSVEKIPMIKIARWHHEAEEYLTESGIACTILRPNIFMQQFTSLFSPSGGLIYLPFGKGAVSYVDARDAAVCAQEIIMNAEQHAGRIYRITGAQKISLHKAASVITEVIGSHVMYADVSEETSRDIMVSLGMPHWRADAFLELYALIRNGLLDEISRDYEEITGTAPSLFLDFVRDYADVLRGLVEE